MKGTTTASQWRTSSHASAATRTPEEHMTSAPSRSRLAMPKRTTSRRDHHAPKICPTITAANIRLKATVETPSPRTSVNDELDTHDSTPTTEHRTRKNGARKRLSARMEAKVRQISAG